METITTIRKHEPIINQLPDISQSLPKVIFWPTNHNNKLACRAFFHIDLVPKKNPTESERDNQLIEIRTQDNSHPPVRCRLYDLLFLQFKQIPDFICMGSHGTTMHALVDYFVNLYGGNFRWETKMAIYLYVTV